MSGVRANLRISKWDLNEVSGAQEMPGRWSFCSLVGAEGS